jgi:hypothetical protein
MLDPGERGKAFLKLSDLRSHHPLATAYGTGNRILERGA